MAQTTKGLRAVLSHPWVYNLWGLALGAPKARADFIERYLRVQPGEALFDIGCGTGKMFEAMPEGIEYMGFDVSKEYVEEAQDRLGDRASFVHAAVGDMPEVPQDHFDVAMATGVLHHLDDDEADGLFALAHGALKTGGRLITSDPVYGEGQSRLAKWVISKDRGLNVRRREAYEALAHRYFERVEVNVRHDRLRIPYTHLIMECIK